MVVGFALGCQPSGEPEQVERPAAGRVSEAPDRAAWMPYVAEGPFASVLVECTAIASAEHSCTLEVLPLIGMSAAEPNLDQIMARVVVSQPWMGRRFREQLAGLPAETLLLFRSVTAVVIGESIRPSYYWAATGAVYLDAAHLWLTAEEKTPFSVYLTSDPEPGPEASLAFASWSRYLREPGIAVRPESDWQLLSRTPEQARPRLAATLFHELAHANDFFPPGLVAHLDPQRSAADAAIEHWGRRPSDQLYDRAPLESAELYRLADILYRRTHSPDQADRSRSAAEIGAAFAADGANDDYAYVSQYEDLAMLFEEVMMWRHLRMYREVAYVVTPPWPHGVCDDYVIAWGMRHRIAAPGVRERAWLVAEALLPEADWTEFFAELGEAQLLPIDAGWCASLNRGMLGGLGHFHDSRGTAEAH